MWPVILGAVVIALTGLAAFFVATARRIARPTTGETIAGNAGNGALLVIDMQEDFTRSQGANAYDPAARDRAIARINDLVAAARQAGEPVAFIRQEHQGRAVQWVASLLLGGAGNPGRPGARLDRDIDAQGAPVFIKHVADAFSAPALDAWLRDQGVGRLTLCGLDLAHCVRSTALGARNRGYCVAVDLAGSLAAGERSACRAKKEMKDAGIGLRGPGAFAVAATVPA
ncbi:cysteine hydrolase family protein [Stappia sp. ES.058]|uniref:cysteine hydrolase family protein n=1 Tax=Stappia sp. ES.058 TaxID=1881061 RepID=UPI00087DE602|nr:isochorismatase family cysteine hydrolase [Stappia sp. ES.058]SDT92180.1 Nicotinamidase-related amidase [Stappia sp. ES.058]